jgi:hypothetical protein
VDVLVDDDHRWQEQQPLAYLLENARDINAAW